MKVTKRGATLFINGSLLVIVVLWTIPLVGLLISSVRNSDAIRSSGWWTVFPHQEQVASEERPIPKGQASDQPITIDGVTKSFQEWKAGVTMPNGSLLTWVGTVRVGKLVVSKQQITADTNFTLDNYGQVLGGQDVEIKRADGTSTELLENRLGHAVLQRGMLPCLRIGVVARLARSMSSDWMSRIRVSPGSITSSTIPRSAAM